TEVRVGVVMGESSILTDGEPVLLVCLSVHQKNIGMFMRHTTSKLMFPLPLHNANSHRKRGRRFGNDSQADIFVQLPTPGQRREYSSDKRRFRGSIKAEIRKFFAKKHTSAPHFPAWDAASIGVSQNPFANWLISNK